MRQFASRSSSRAAGPAGDRTRAAPNFPVVHDRTSDAIAESGPFYSRALLAISSPGEACN
jgi:hypothetical protein